MAVVNIKFTKFDNTPWGFRLAGGSDFPQPLTVIKVAEGSLAECMGLMVGDVVTRLNDRPVSSLTHGQAHEALVLAGNNFALGVLRPTSTLLANEAIQEDNIVPYTIPLDQLPPVYPEEILTEARDEYVIEEETIIETVVEEAKEELAEKIVDENSEVVPNKDLTDEEIAQLILEEEELLLPDQGVLGVNFKKLRPRIAKLKESKVLEELQKISVADPPRVQELKHTSTFLQKPQRPPPPSKSDLDKQASEEGEQYRVVIKKQQKKSVTERLLEKGLLEPREDKIPQATNEVNDDDDRTLGGIREINMLQVMPRVREISIVQRENDFPILDEKPEISAPNMHDLLKLLDSVQSLEALLIEKCARQGDAMITEPSAPADNDETDVNDDTCTINYTPWCNAFKTEVQLQVPGKQVFAEFTVNIGNANRNNSEPISDAKILSPLDESNSEKSQKIKSIFMPNVRKARKLRTRIRFFKSRLTAQKLSTEGKKIIANENVRIIEWGKNYFRSLRLSPSNSKRWDVGVFLDPICQLLRTTGSFVSSKIFHRGRVGRLSRRSRRYANTKYSRENRDASKRRDSNSKSIVVSRQIPRNEEIEYRNDQITDTDRDKSRLLYEEECEKSDISNSSLNYSGDLNLAKLAACAVVPFTSIILLYLYK